MTDVPIRRALLSVSDKDGLAALAGTLADAVAAGLTPRACLAAHDSYTLFDRTGSLIRTGPTLTNVNDFRAVLVR